MTDNPSGTAPIKRLSEEWWATRSPEIRARRCHAHRRNGDQCTKVALAAQQVCGTHGGFAPQNKAKARRRIEEAADRMAARLLEFAEAENVPAYVALAATESALDRAGLKPPAQVEVGPKEPAPWEQLMGDVAKITKAQHDALKRGEPLPPAPAALPPGDDALDIVDAEVVEADPGPHPERHGERADAVGQPPSLRPDFAGPTGLPSRALVPLEDATSDAARANRSARVVQTRRRG